MKTFLLSCLAALALVSIVGCSDSEHHADTTSSYQSASMTSDTKDMHPVHQ